MNQFEEEEPLNFYSTFKLQGHTPYELFIQQEILDAFEALDERKKGLAHVREVGLVMRSLDCFPTEAEIQDLLALLDKNEDEQYQVADIIPLLKTAFLEDRFKRPSKDILTKAFEFLENENEEGILGAEDMSCYLNDLGEPMSKEAIDEFIALVKDEKTGRVNYKAYIEQLYSRELYKP